MSSQESVGEIRVSHPTPGPGANIDAYHFGPSTEEEIEADLKRIDAMEGDQEVTSRFRARFTMGKLQSSAIPNLVIPSNVRFLSYENMKKSVTCSLASMQHPWVKGTLAVTGAYHRTQGHYPQIGGALTLHVRLSIITTTFFTSKGGLITWVWALPLATAKLGGGSPVSYHHHTPIFTIFLSLILLVIY